jgi:hypothetical protein
MDLIQHLTRQTAVSRATFGPGPRTKGVTDHITKELREVQKVYQGNDGDPKGLPDCHVHRQAAEEWVDVAILGLDGLTRAVWAANPTWDAARVSAHACLLIECKQGKNEKRSWPDWRTADPEVAIEHVRGIED